MEEKLQFVPSLKDAFAIGMKNLVPIVLSVLLWLVTVWIPYVNVGTTIALATLPVKLSKGEMISPMFIFESKYHHLCRIHIHPVHDCSGNSTLAQLDACCLSSCR